MEIVKLSSSRKQEVIKKHVSTALSIFIDGVNLDRACRRLKKRINLSALLSSLAGGKEIVTAKYYTLIPFEDDHRHRAYLDAVARAGFEVVTKRMPPKGVQRQVGVDVDLASDMLNFGLNPKFQQNNNNLKKSIIVVCPSLELSYPLKLLGDLGVKTTTADFSKVQRGDLMKSAANWVDLTDSDSIWIG